VHRKARGLRNQLAGNKQTGVTVFMTEGEDTPSALIKANLTVFFVIIFRADSKSLFELA
jgi:hypothetical protein